MNNQILRPLLHSSYTVIVQYSDHPTGIEYIRFGFKLEDYEIALETFHCHSVPGTKSSGHVEWCALYSNQKRIKFYQSQKI